ncbi:M20 family metallopeptidase [Chengkuizengella axinellae]|uniref:M20 family metallopeptidase n=1 Tax=Chengkuizengella axinellae TaxID=3064388 RepID=A0ABT9ITP8_9BACL|nr:M20 family metallopeptidase [Chengkuizengella sp. 2205SS18-9]MDP5272662.1 M20 family metallopeptidase [Chengkuizengella sp. 2205SS18-9]
MSIEQHIKDHQNLYLKMLEESVNMDSPSKNKHNSDRVAQWYANQFENLIAGGAVKMIKNKEYGDFLRCQIGDGDKQLLLIGHFDTVFPMGESEKRPFYIKEDKAFGPGVYDMKSGILEGFFALKALVDEGEFPSDRSVVFFINSDEEIGSRSSKQMIMDEARKSEAALVLECPMEPDGSLKTSRKGCGRYKIIVEGVSAHSGVNPQDGVSAIEEMAVQIQRLHALNNYETGTNVNVGVIKGGLGPNIIANFAEAEIDVRVQSSEELNRIEEIFKEFKPVSDGATLQITGGVLRPPMERTDGIEELFEQAKKIGEVIGMDIKESGTGGGSDGNFIASCGVPLLDGLGIRGGHAHSPKEFIYVHEIPKKTLFLANLIKSLKI